MDKAAAVARIREQLTQGDIEAALQLLIQKLEPERKQLRNLSNRAIQAKAQLEKTQRDELQGVISFENSKLSYNQITQQVISLVDEWENPSEETARQKRKFTPKMTLVVFVLLAFTGVITTRMIKRNNRVNISNTAGACPTFEPKSDFNIMVLPFNSLKDSEIKSQSLQVQIVRRLDRMKENFSKNVKTSIKGKSDPPPSNDEDAIQSGLDCLAKLVIWGEFEKLEPTTPRTIVTTNYKYLSPAETFAFTKFNLDDNSEVASTQDLSNIPTQGNFVDTITSLSSITTDGELTGRLEDQFRLLFGVAVMQSGDAKSALKILESTSAPDSNSSLLKDMALAESHLLTGDKAAASKAYDRVLEEHPNYWFALNNRAMLYYQEGDFAEALNTVERKLKETPDDPTALTMRGALRIQTKQLKEAEEDLRKADDLTTENPNKKEYIRKKIELLEKEKSAEETRKVKATSLLTRDRNNIAALTDLAESNRNLGDYEKADKIADQIISIQPSNTQAIAIKLETSSKLKNDQEIRTIIRKVENMDPETKSAILEDRPVLKTILKVKNQ